MHQMGLSMWYQCEVFRSEYFVETHFIVMNIGNLIEWHFRGFFSKKTLYVFLQCDDR